MLRGQYATCNAKGQEKQLFGSSGLETFSRDGAVLRELLRVQQRPLLQLQELQLAKSSKIWLGCILAIKIKASHLCGGQPGHRSTSQRHLPGLAGSLNGLKLPGGFGTKVARIAKIPPRIEVRLMMVLSLAASDVQTDGAVRTDLWPPWQGVQQQRHPLQLWLVCESQFRSCSTCDISRRHFRLCQLGSQDFGATCLPKPGTKPSIIRNSSLCKRWNKNLPPIPKQARSRNPIGNEPVTDAASMVGSLAKKAW